MKSFPHDGLLQGRRRGCRRPRCRRLGAHPRPACRHHTQPMPSLSTYFLPTRTHTRLFGALCFPLRQPAPSLHPACACVSGVYSRRWPSPRLLHSQPLPVLPACLAASLARLLSCLGCCQPNRRIRRRLSTPFAPLTGRVPPHTLSHARTHAHSQPAIHTPLPYTPSPPLPLSPPQPRPQPQPQPPHPPHPPPPHSA